MTNFGSILRMVEQNEWQNSTNIQLDTNFDETNSPYGSRVISKINSVEILVDENGSPVSVSKKLSDLGAQSTVLGQIKSITK